MSADASAGRAGVSAARRPAREPEALELLKLLALATQATALELLLPEALASVELPEALAPVW
ncbi:MAG: hypothetical protein WA446_03535 [Steroidobacteraceae bacterium]